MSDRCVIVSEFQMEKEEEQVDQVEGREEEVAEEKTGGAECKR